MEDKKDDIRIASPKPHVGSLWKATLAGGITGAIEASIMFPTEFVKTQLQLQGKNQPQKFKGPIDCAVVTVKEHGPLGLYRGLSSLVVGSAPKVAVRFTAFEKAKQSLKDENGKLSAGSNMLAGLFAGASEAVLAVTPMETIKTKLIHDMNNPPEKRKYHGLVHGVRTIVAQEGLSGIYKGLVPTVLKQSTNQATRFLVYEELKKYLESNSKVPLSVGWSLLCGATAGGVSVLVNNPLDVIKTKMQGLDSHLYKSSWDCAKKILQQQGVMFFYRGVSPRLIRVCGDSAITFTIYSKVVDLINSFSR
eukprot:TRINITY_DN2538_c0_g1_i1.p1 TRINITY_DN2538_c0_g1~~TRINITY_DN2538_c0_g1_i1.p1  ORF type:complete len:306 (-),score=51.65 TRINITY_DN2538_c0_g1_i1:67-984(-)